MGPSVGVVAEPHQRQRGGTRSSHSAARSLARWSRLSTCDDTTPGPDAVVSKLPRGTVSVPAYPVVVTVIAGQCKMLAWRTRSRGW